MTIAEAEDVYKLRPEVEITEAGAKELSNLAAHVPPLAAPTPDSRKSAVP